MDPIEEFEFQFNQNYTSLVQLFQVTQQPLPTTILNPQLLTVTQYLAVLDNYEQRLRAIPVESINAIDPFLLESYGQEDRDFVAALAAQDFATVLVSLNAGRDFVAGVDPSSTIRDFIIASNPGIEFGDPPGSGPVAPPVDNSGNAQAEIEQALETYRGELSDLLWSEQSGEYASPMFDVNLETGAWITINTSGGNVRGSSLSGFYSYLGDAAARAIMSFIDTQQGLVEAAVAQGGTADAFATATSDAESAARRALETLQELGAELTEQGSATPSDIEAQASSRAQSLINALETALPGLNGALDAMVLGSRNSDPSFIISPDGGAIGSEHGDWFYLSANSDSFDGGQGKDVLFGLQGADTLNGDGDEDQLFGGGGNDQLSGGAQNDMLIGGAGDDTLDGGTGDGDVANFAGGMGQYTLRLSQDGSIVVQDREAGGEGSDTLTNIETLSFDSGATIFTDGMLDLSIIQGITGLDETEVATFIELYIAYFNRAPDALGLYFWGSAFANGTSLEETAELFQDQDETRATYPEGETNLAFATQVYSNVLGRVPDQEGLEFWEEQLDSGNVSRGAFILEVLRGTKVTPGADVSEEFATLQLQDRIYLEDKTDIGTYFSVIKGLSNVDDAAQAMQLYVRGDDSTIQSAIAEIDSDYAQAVTAESGELILQLVGVANDPFSV